MKKKKQAEEDASGRNGHHSGRFTTWYSDMAASQQVHVTCLLRFLHIGIYIHQHIKTVMALQGEV